MTEITREDADGPRDSLLDFEDEARPDPVEQADVARMVWKAVDGLSEDYRAVLVLRDVEDMPSKEVAAALGVSDASVRQRLHRARQSIAEQLRPELCAGRRLTCGGDLNLLFDWIDGALPDNLREPVGDHLATCPGCRDFLPKYRRTVEAPKIADGILGPPKAPDRLIQSALASVRGG